MSPTTEWINSVRLTIRLVLVLVALLAVMLAVHSDRLSKSAKQKQARLELSQGAQVACFRVSDSSDSDSFFYAPEPKYGIRKWLADLFGEDYVSDTIFVARANTSTSREQFELIKQLRGVRALFTDESEVELAEWTQEFPDAVILFGGETMVVPADLQGSHIEYWRASGYAEPKGNYTLVFNSDVVRN